MRRSFGVERPKRGCLLPLLLILAVVFLSVRLFSVPAMAFAAQQLIEDDGPRKADAIVVLGGDGYGDRTLKGAQLAKEGFAPLVYLSGPPHLMGFDCDEEIRYAASKGYPDALFRGVPLPVEAESTETEAEYLGKYLTARGVKSVLLVTSNYHTRRAAKLWRRANPNLTVTVVPSVDPHGYFTVATWWKTRPGKKAFLYEWMKTVSVVLGV